jgi:hypothetical protein
LCGICAIILRLRPPDLHKTAYVRRLPASHAGRRRRIVRLCWRAGCVMHFAWLSHCPCRQHALRDFAGARAVLCTLHGYPIAHAASMLCATLPVRELCYALRMAIPLPMLQHALRGFAGAQAVLFTSHGYPIAHAASMLCVALLARRLCYSLRMAIPLHMPLACFARLCRRAGCVMHFAWLFHCPCHQKALRGFAIAPAGAR